MRWKESSIGCSWSLGKPKTIVSDNRPEFRAMTLPAGVSNQFTQPGKPWQNGYIGSFFGKLRDELWSCELFVRGAELQAALADFQDHYNYRRPHLGLGGLTPASFKQRSQTTPEAEILHSQGGNLSPQAEYLWVAPMREVRYSRICPLISSIYLSTFAGSVCA